MSDLKIQLHQLCIAAVEKRLALLRTAMEEARTAGMEETKSSAGDKYETGRAMMHLEMEKLAGQLSEAEKQKSLLSLLPLTEGHIVQSGSVVYTSKGNYFLSASVGIMEVGGHTFTTLSAASPLGGMLLGKSVGETVTLNKKTIQILKVF
ncbi:MAG: 3-oxoacyl-ACP synthase [Bacteroidota bacterium]